MQLEDGQSEALFILDVPMGTGFPGLFAQRSSQQELNLLRRNVSL
jgi:hypothetical protein